MSKVLCLGTKKLNPLDVGALSEKVITDAQVKVETAVDKSSKRVKTQISKELKANLKLKISQSDASNYLKAVLNALLGVFVSVWVNWFCGKLADDGKLSATKKPAEKLTVAKDKMVRLGSGLKLSYNSIVTLWQSFLTLLETAFEVYKASGVMTADNKASVISAVESQMGVLIEETVSSDAVKAILADLVGILTPVLVSWTITWLVAKGVITYSAA